VRTLAKHWRCPKCGYEIHEPIRVSAVVHPCHVNNDGTPRSTPLIRSLDPVLTVFNAVIVVDAPAVQLTLDEASR
jgi:hypothetical protein